MHRESYHEMRRLLGEWRRRLPADANVLDIGSQNINGCYRPLMPVEWRYTGTDIAGGPNVDVVMPAEFSLPFEDGAFDVTLCGQVFEHCRDPHRLAREIARVMRPGAMAFWTAPSKWPTHRYPIDCFRILADGMRAMMEMACIEVILCRELPSGGPKKCNADCWGVGRKLATAPPVTLRGSPSAV